MLVRASFGLDCLRFQHDRSSYMNQQLSDEIVKNESPTVDAQKQSARCVQDGDNRSFEFKIQGFPLVGKTPTCLVILSPRGKPPAPGVSAAPGPASLFHGCDTCLPRCTGDLSVRPQSQLPASTAKSLIFMPPSGRTRAVDNFVGKLCTDALTACHAGVSPESPHPERSQQVQ